MDLDLGNQRVLVTGSSSGIGLSIAKAFAEEGSQVCLTGRDPKKLESALRKITGKKKSAPHLSFAGDLSVSKDIKTCVQMLKKKLAKLDHLVLNLGSGEGERGLAAKPDEWLKIFEINLFAGIRFLHEALALMTSSHSSITFISSVTGVESISTLLHYSSAKAAVIAAAKGLAKELGPRGIRVNTIAPGHIFFKGGVWDKKSKSEPELVRKMTDYIPLKRFGAPEEIANAVLFLASSKASYITGETLVVDGGLTRAY